jgi:hypothetical protein
MRCSQRTRVYATIFYNQSAKIENMSINPARCGYVPNPFEQKYLNIHRFIKQGILRRI